MVSRFRNISIRFREQLIRQSISNTSVAWATLVGSVARQQDIAIFGIVVRQSCKICHYPSRSLTCISEENRAVIPTNCLSDGLQFKCCCSRKAALRMNLLRNSSSGNTSKAMNTCTKNSATGVLFREIFAATMVWIN